MEMITCHHVQESDYHLLFFTESDTASQGLYDKTSLRTMLAVIDYLRHQQRPLESERFAMLFNEFCIWTCSLSDLLKHCICHPAVALCATQTSGLN